MSIKAQSGEWWIGLNSESFDNLARIQADTILHIQQRSINERYLLACISSYNEGAIKH